MNNPTLKDLVRQDIINAGFEAKEYNYFMFEHDPNFFQFMHENEIKFDGYARFAARGSFTVTCRGDTIKIICSWAGRTICDLGFNIMDYKNQIVKSLKELKKRMNLYKKLSKARRKQ